MKFVLLFVFAVISADGAEEGDVCKSNGVDGRMQEPRQLYESLPRYSEQEPNTGYMRLEKSSPIVCCKTGTDVTSTVSPVPTTNTGSPVTSTKYTSIESEESIEYFDNTYNLCEPIPSNFTSKPTGQKAWDKCIEYQDKYVYPCRTSSFRPNERVNYCRHNAEDMFIEGTVAAKGEFPHMVKLGYKNGENKIEWQCGGSLISEKFVLTAAHCTSNIMQTNVTHALIGALKEELYGIKRIIKHDSYQAPHKYHDIALLELDRAVSLTHYTVPACLHTGDPVDERRAFATGWGNTQNSPDTLQRVLMTKSTAQECSSQYQVNGSLQQGFNETTQICYGLFLYAFGNTCQGTSSGGPLQVKNKQIACMYTVIGVTSVSNTCDSIGLPGIYTRVSHYLPWIESIVWPN